MKKVFLTLTGLLVVLAISAAIYYKDVVESGGTETIRYIEPEENYQSLADLANHPDLKGKVIYVDFWHTGCGPCFVEFESMPAIKEAFKNRNDMAFLYLGKDRSAPGEKFRWKRVIEKKNLTGYHFFMSNEQYDKFWEESVKDETVEKAFPHYLIIDRDGAVVHQHAPRPSDQNLLAVLGKVLDKN